MRKLDADKKPLSVFSKKTFEGFYQTRDCVQFLAYRDHKNDPEKITRELLREIPDQVTSYFDSKKIFPGKPDEKALKKFE